MVYEYRVKGLFKVPAQIAGEECARLESSPVGLSPHTLLDASRDVNAPLHNEFEWDDTVAAERFRESQAHNIIRNIYVVHNEIEEKHAVRAYVPVSAPEFPSKYNSIKTVIKHDSMREKLLATAKRDCDSFIKKYDLLEELSEVIDKMEDFIAN